MLAPKLWAAPEGGMVGTQSQALTCNISSITSLKLAQMEYHGFQDCNSGTKDQQVLPWRNTGKDWRKFKMAKGSHKHVLVIGSANSRTAEDSVWTNRKTASGCQNQWEERIKMCPPIGAVPAKEHIRTHFRVNYHLGKDDW